MCSGYFQHFYYGWMYCWWSFCRVFIMQEKRWLRSHITDSWLKLLVQDLPVWMKNMNWRCYHNIDNYLFVKKSTSCGRSTFFNECLDAHCAEVCALYLITGTNLCAGCNEYKTDLWKRLSRCADYILSKCSWSTSLPGGFPDMKKIL